MRKSVKAIGTITAMGTIAFGSYLSGTMQAVIVTEVQTVTEKAIDWAWLGRQHCIYPGIL
jgi:hypothetical protein